MIQGDMNTLVQNAMHVSNSKRGYMSYRVSWLNMFGDWITVTDDGWAGYDKHFTFYASARRYVAKRIVRPNYVKKWRISDSSHNVLLEVERK